MSLTTEKRDIDKQNLVELSVNAKIEQMKTEFAKVLMDDGKAERFTRIAITAVKANDKLSKLPIKDLLHGCMIAAQYGLEPDPSLGHFALVPFYDKENGRYNVTPIVMYRGYMELARRSGQISFIDASVVYENEIKQSRFKALKGDSPSLYHEPILFGERGNPVGAYAIAKFKDGTTLYDAMSVADMEKRRKIAKTQKVWNEWTEEMYRKTVIRRLAKYLPLSFEGNLALQIESAVDEGKAVRMDAEGGLIVEGTAVEVELSEPEKRFPEKETAPTQEESSNIPKQTRKPRQAKSEEATTAPQEVEQKHQPIESLNNPPPYPEDDEPIESLFPNG